VKPRAALLLLGSNRGDRAARLAGAVAALRRAPGIRVEAASRIYETAPVGPSDRPFLNQALRVRTVRTAMGLLLEAKRLEAAAGRRPGPRWGARPLDCDLIALGRERVRTPWLSVPHPLAARRPFALAPLAEVAGGWRPDGRRTARALLDAMRPRPGIVKIWRGR
jgi:2-amino-4-hydroxy-6-hydroxymethyldihydropteridine diphosphokinase